MQRFTLVRSPGLGASFPPAVTPVPLGLPTASCEALGASPTSLRVAAGGATAIGASFDAAIPRAQRKYTAFANARQTTMLLRTVKCTPPHVDCPRRTRIPAGGLPVPAVMLRAR